MNVYSLCTPHLRHRPKLILYIAIILLTAALSILSPYIIGDFLDTLISGADISSVLVFCALFGA